MQHTFFVHFFPLFCTTVTWNVQKLPSYAFYGGNVGRVLVHSFFTVAHFHPGGRQHPAATKFHFVPPTENVSFCFFPLALAPFLVVLRWSVALLSLFLCLSLSLYSKFVDMTINLSLILKKNTDTETFSPFRFRLYWLFIVSASQDAGGYTLSRQNYLTFGIGLPVVSVRMVVRTLRHNQIFSDG